MKKISTLLDDVSITSETPKSVIISSIKNNLQHQGYVIEEINEDKPWGAYVRINNGDAEQFLDEFFPGLSIADASLGLPSVEISPKILIVEKGKRLSWQLHHRRAERWTFLTNGAYYKSETDEQGAIIYAKPGEAVQFVQGERHRLVGAGDGYTVVAEIWQHTNAANLSDENDIVRLDDDFSR